MAIELDVVLLREVLQDEQRLVPLVLRDVRVDRVGRDDLAGRVDDGDLDAGAEAGVEAHRGALPGRGGEQQVLEVGGEDVDGLGLGGLPQAHPQVDAQVDEDARAPGPADGVVQPLVGGTALVDDAERRRRSAARRTRTGRSAVGVEALVGGVEGEVEDLFLLGAEHREHAVRLEPAERLGEVEVVAVLLAVLLLALADLGDQVALGPHALAELCRSGRRPRRSARRGSRGRRRGRRRRRRRSRSGSRPPPASGRSPGRSSSRSARGSRPFSRAICALVRRFGLYGR